MQDEIAQQVIAAVNSSLQRKMGEQINQAVKSAMQKALYSILSVKPSHAQLEQKLNADTADIGTKIDEAMTRKLNTDFGPRIAQLVDQKFQNANLGQFLEAKLQSRDLQITGAINTAGESESRFEKIETKMEHDERAERVDTLIVDGFKFVHGKTLKQIVINNMEYYLGVTLYESDMRYMTWFGPDRQDGLPKSLKIIFIDVDLKNELLKQKGRLKTTDVVFTEYLTEKHNNVFIQTKLARKNKLLSSTWIIHWTVYAMSKQNWEAALVYALHALKLPNDRVNPLNEDRDSTDGN